MSAVDRLKVAIIRDPDAPIGQPAKMWANCPCGAKPAAVDGPIHCACGAVYDAQGWRVA